MEADVPALVRQGVRVLHLIADYHGRAGDRFARDAILRAHRRLVEEGLREGVTLLGGGGIVLAEHVPKAILCGLDAVSLETAVCAALQARFRGDCRDREAARIELPRLEREWAVQRLANLARSWRDQLLEFLGAMGMREVRRLRGEVGRCMFQEDLEREAFSGIAEDEARA
jgi:glutamate synthase domain-containing protein 2